MRVLRGNDILINWSVFYDAGGVKTNVDFSNSTLSVFILDSYGKRAVEHTVSGNVISIHYGGEIQRLGTIAIDAYWQNNNTLVWSRAKKNEVVELVDNPESVTLDGIPTDISITTINTSSDTFFGGTYNANFSNYYTKEEIDNKVISDYNFLSNKPLVYDEETGKYTAVDAPINFVNNINIGNFVAGVSGINFAANGSGEVGTLTVRDRLIVNGVEITGSGTGGLDVTSMWNELGSAENTDKQINVVHLTDALSGYLQTSTFDDLFEKVNIGTLETPKYAIKAKYDFYSIGEVSAFGAGTNNGSEGGGLIQTVYGISGLSATYSDANLTETFNAAAIKKIYDDVVTLQGGSLINYSLTGTGNAITGVTKSGNSLNFVKGSTFSLNGHTHSFGDISGLPTTLSGYGITDGVNTTTFNSLVNNFNTHVTSDVHLTATQKNILAHLQIVEGKLQADIDFYSTGEVSAFGAGSGGSSGGGLIQTVYGYSSLGSAFNNTTLTDTFNAYTINQLHTRLSQVEVGAAVNVAVSGTGNAITGVTKNGNVLEFTKGSTFSLVGHTHDYIPLSQKGTANGVASLDANGLIVSAQLPSYVDDVIEVSSYANLPTVGESGKIYVTTDTNITYRWTGTTYVEISKSIALGETSSTAYRGDLGAIAYAHSQIAGGTGVHISGTERTNWNIAYTNSHTHANKSLLDDFSQSDNDVLNHLSIVDGKLKIDIDLYSLGEISAFGAGSGSGGSGLIQTVYGLSGLGGTYSNATLTDTFNAYAINSLHDRINSLEAGSALNFTTTGSGNVVTSVTKSGTSVSVVKGLIAVLEGDSRLTNSRPNPYALTFSGYSSSTYDGSAAVSVALPTKVSQLTNDSGYLTSIDADLVAIAALTGTSGLLRKTAANTWSLDTNAYLTSITKAQVEGVLTGNITTHTHSQYLTGNQTITVSGDATGSGATSIALTLANSGVVAGTYNNSATQVRPFTVDAKGRVTGIGTAVTITPAWGSVTGKPTTIGGYGITDAYTKTQTDGFLALKLDKTTFNDLFEKVNIGTTASPVYAIKAKYNFYSVGEVSAFGAGAGSGGSGLIQAVYGYSGLGGAYNNATLTDTFNAYTINKINADLGARITSLESGSALTFTTVGSGNAVTSVTKSGTGVTVTKGLTFSVDGHTHTFANLTSKPTTLSGYGITDAATGINGYATDIYVADTRSVTTTPNFINRGVKFDFKSNAVDGLSDGGSYYGQMTFRPYGSASDWSGSKSHQLGFTDNDNIWHRSGSTSWGSWNKLYHSGNFTNLNQLTTRNFSDLQNKPTTLSGYGITNAYTTSSADNTFLKLAGGTLTGDIYLNTNKLRYQNNSIYLEADGLGGALIHSNQNGYIHFGPLNTAFAHIYTDRHQFYFNKDLFVAGYTVWHSGNDGSGSGLDADYIRGYTVNTGSAPFNTIPLVGFDGVMEIGAYIDMHYDNTGSFDYSTRLRCQGNYQNSVNLPTASGTLALLSDNVASATRLQTTRTIWGQSFNGTGNVSGALTGVSTINASGDITTSGSVYTNGKANTGDQDLSNLSTYTYVDNTFLKLAGGTMTGAIYVNNSTNSTSTTTGAIRTAGGLGVVGNGYFGGTVTAPTFSGALSGNASSATKLATARTLWGQSFDGTGNVSGAMTGVSTITMSGALTGGTTSSFSSYSTANRFYTGYDSGVANSISCSNWFRSSGATGWYNDTYAGGINMTDTTYVRVSNNKAFWVNNNIVATGEITAFGASDIRLKSNIKQINSALDFLSKVKTYEFDWNEKAIELNPLKTKRGAGVIAQEMSLLDKNFVHSIYGDYLGVDYERFIPYLIGGVNEVADEVTILKKRVAELELEIKQLKK